jgi:hypothetical protein
MSDIEAARRVYRDYTVSKKGEIDCSWEDALVLGEFDQQHGVQIALAAIAAERKRGQKVADCLAALHRECGGGKLGPNNGVTTDISGFMLRRTAKALAEWEAGK